MHAIYVGKCKDPFVTQSKLATYRPDRGTRPWRVVDTDNGRVVEEYWP